MTDDEREKISRDDDGTGGGSGAPRLKLRGDIGLAFHPEAFTLSFQKDLAIDDTPGLAVLKVGADALAECYSVVANVLDAKAALAATLPPISTRGLGSAQSMKVVAEAAARPLPRAQELVAFAETAFASAAKKHDAALKTIARISVDIGKEIDALSSPADVSSAKAIALHSEIRGYVKSLDQPKRRGFVERAIKDGDAETAHAVVNSLSYLSGLTPVEANMLRETAHERFAPELHTQRKAIDRAMLNLQNAGRVFVADYQKALPKVPKKVTAADAAMNVFKRRA